MSRRADGWLEAYMQYVQRTEPPRLFKLWSGISTIAACLERKLWMPIWDTNIYPNMYIVLVGPSSVRKSTAMSPSRHFLEEVGVNISAEATTREALIRKMKEVNTSFIDTTTEMPMQHSSLTIFSSELAVFIGYNNPQLISDLTNWFDSDKRWVYDTKHEGKDSIAGVWVNLIGATTPDLLQSILPQDAIGGGLTSRIVFVFGDAKSCVAPRLIMTKEERQLRDDLLMDLGEMHSLSGEFLVEESWWEKYEPWYEESDATPAIQDHNFEPYLGRRPLHIMKLSMICSISRSSELALTGDDFETALTILTETEKYMPNVFRGYGRGDLTALIPRVMALIAQKKSCVKSELYQHFYRDCSPDQFDQLLQTMIGIKFATAESTGGGKTVIRCIKEKKDVDPYG